MSRGCRIYIGNLPPDCRWIITHLEVDFKFLSLLFSREKDLDRFFKGYGRKTDVLIKQVKYLRRRRNWVTNFPFNYDQMFYKTKIWMNKFIWLLSGIWICWIWGLSWRRRRRLWAKWQRSFGREVSSFSSLSCYTFLMKKFSLPSLSIDHSFNVQSVCWTRQGHPSCSLKGQGEVSLFKHTLLSVKRSGHLIFHGRLSVVRRFSRYRAEPFSKLRITT